MTWAKPGVRCVYIDDTPARLSWSGERLPILGQEYTVRAVWTSKRGTIGITVFEIVNSIGPRGREWGFRVARFRPVVPISGDMSLFHHHLNLIKELA